MGLGLASCSPLALAWPAPSSQGGADFISASHVTAPLLGARYLRLPRRSWVDSEAAHDGGLRT
jgi:hypothetical protein